MSHSHGRKKNKERVTYLLESGSADSMRKAKQITEEQIKFEYEYYAALARQRSAIRDEISQSLIKPSIPYEIKRWQRAVKYKYSLHPLSVSGSLSFIGGRFNTGENVNSEVPIFPALYLAEDKDTALQEHLGQGNIANNKSKLTPREIALTHPASETIVSVSGAFDQIFDLTNIKNLKHFIELIKNFSITPQLIKDAKKLGKENLLLVKTPRMLHNTLLASNWREHPSNYDVPASSQIFGHLIYLAGIEGILYPSKFTRKLCLALFPRNFVNTDSFICLDDDLPHEKIPKKINANNWRFTEMEMKEIISTHDI